MNFSTAMLVTGILSIGLGVAFLTHSNNWQHMCHRFLRSPKANLIFFGSAAIWFIYNVSQLSSADEIAFLTRELMLVIFSLVALLAFRYVPDFLSVRGFCIWVLLFANLVLKASWMQYSVPQYLLNGYIYLWIIVALYMGALPYKMRDFLNWTFAQPFRARALGGFLAACGAILLAAFTQI